MSKDIKTDNYTLLLGDCLERMKEIPDGSVDLILTDPPYKVITGGRGGNGRPSGILLNNGQLMQCIPKFDEWLRWCFRVLKEDSHAYFMSNLTNLEEMLTSVRRAGFLVHNLLVWEKNNCTPSQWYMKNCEYVIFCRKGKAKYINNIGSKTVHKFENPRNKVHPTEKPADLMGMYIENSSEHGEVVLDLFMGSGTTGVACVNTGRKFIGIEMDERYFNVAKDRLLCK